MDEVSAHHLHLACSHVLRGFPCSVHLPPCLVGVVVLGHAYSLSLEIHDRFVEALANGFGANYCSTALASFLLFAVNWLRAAYRVLYICIVA